MMEDKKKDISEYLLQFINDCYQENSISHIMETAYRYYGNPCALYDNHYKVLSWHGQAKESDQIFNETRKNGYLSRHVLDYFIDSGYMEKDYTLLDTNSIPTVYQEDRFTSKRIGIAIPSSKNGVSGWFAVFETDRKLDETDLYLTSWLAKLLYPLMNQKDSFTYTPRAEDVLSDVLSGMAEPDHVKELLEQTGCRLPAKMRLLTIASEKGKIPDPARVVVRSVSDRDTIFINYYDHILILMDSGKVSVVKERMGETIGKLNLVAAISEEFSSVHRLKQCYTRNLECMKIGLRAETGERIFLYDDYTGELFLYAACKSMPGSEYMNPQLKKIEKYDRENQTEYYQSLRSYILYGNNMKRAAAELKIHRNTLNYRIGMISRLFDIDLYDQNTIKKLHLAFAIEDCRKLI